MTASRQGLNSEFPTYQLCDCQVTSPGPQFHHLYNEADNSTYLIRVKWNKTLKASNNNWYILNSLWAIIIYNFLWWFEIITFKARNGLQIKNRTLKKNSDGVMRLIGLEMKQQKIAYWNQMNLSLAIDST